MNIIAVDVHHTERFAACSTVNYSFSPSFPQAFAEWLEGQLDAQEGSSVVTENIKLLGRDAVIQTIRRLVSEHPEVAMDSVIHIMQTVDPSQRQDISKILANMDASVGRPSFIFMNQINRSCKKAMNANSCAGWIVKRLLDGRGLNDHDHRRDRHERM